MATIELSAKASDHDKEKIDPRLEAYNAELAYMKKAISTNFPDNEYVFNHMFSQHGYYDKYSFGKNSKGGVLFSISLNRKNKVKENTDFTLTPLIRTLYLGYIAEKDHLNPDTLPDVTRTSKVTSTFRWLKHEDVSAIYLMMIISNSGQR